MNQAEPSDVWLLTTEQIVPRAHRKLPRRD